MNLEETGIIMDILSAAYPRFYGGVGETERVKTLNLWAEMFADDDVALVAAAVKRHIASDIKGFPPHIGAIKNAMYSLSQVGELDVDQAWELLRSAVSRSGYGAQEEFDRLPENLKRMAGSPSQLHEWSQMDSDIFNSVIASNFRKAWIARRESRRQDALLPGDVKRLLLGISKPIQLEDGT